MNTPTPWNSKPMTTFTSLSLSKQVLMMKYLILCWYDCRKIHNQVSEGVFEAKHTHTQFHIAYLKQQYDGVQCMFVKVLNLRAKKFGKVTYVILKIRQSGWRSTPPPPPPYGGLHIVPFFYICFSTSFLHLFFNTVSTRTALFFVL